MPHEFTTSYVKDSVELFRYYKKLAERGIAQVGDEQLFQALDGETNSIAITAKHMAGNMRSRWSDFLNSDGEKLDRNRDSEFEDQPKTRKALMFSTCRQIRRSVAAKVVHGKPVPNRKAVNHAGGARSGITSHRWQVLRRGNVPAGRRWMQT